MQLPQKIEEKHKLLTELLNRALSESSESLTKLLKHEVHLKTKRSEILEPWEITEHFAQADEVFTVVAVKLINEIKGFMLIVFKEKCALKIAEHLTSKYETKINTDLSELEKSALKEVGNIVAGSVLTKVSRISEVSASVTIPDLSTDMIKATLDELSAEIALREDKAHAISNDFVITPLDINGSFVFILDDSSIDQILLNTK